MALICPHLIHLELAQAYNRKEELSFKFNQPVCSCHPVLWTLFVNQFYILYYGYLLKTSHITLQIYYIVKL